MTRFSRMLIQCAWCTKLIGFSAPTTPGRCDISHGICAPCAQRLQPRISAAQGENHIAGAGTMVNAEGKDAAT
jgi:hypothetical protein